MYMYSMSSVRNDGPKNRLELEKIQDAEISLEFTSEIGIRNRSGNAGELP